MTMIPHLYDQRSKYHGRPVHTRGLTDAEPNATCDGCATPLRLDRRRRGRIFCSDQCESKFYRKPRESARRREQCSECGSEFEAKRSDALYCSDTCRQRAKRQRDKVEALD